MRWPIALSIFRRDLLEALRDRRTLLLLIVVPMLLYPMLMVGGAMLTGTLKKQSQDKPLKLAVWGPAPAGLLDRVEKAGSVEWTDRREALPADPTLEAQALLRERKAHAVLALTPRHAPGSEDNLGLELYIDGSRSGSAKARERLNQVFEQARIHTVRERFQQAGLSPELAEPLQVKESNFRSMGVWLAPLLIYLVLMALMLSGFYPAIDITAGEKERGTLQTLLCAPVRPLEVVLGKYGVVFVFALGGGLMNLLGIGLAALALGGMGGALSGIRVSAPVLLGAFGALVPLTLLVSALFIAVGVMARSFKEAQNYLTPLLMLVFILAGGAMVSEVELNPRFALVPILNVALVLRELLTTTVSPSLFSLVFVSSLAWAMAGILLATRVFESEQVLLSGEKPWRDVFGQRVGRRDWLSPGNALLFFAVLLTASLYVGLLLGERLPLWARLVGIQVGLFLGLSVLWAKRSGAPLRDVFSLRLPTWRGALGLLLLVPAMFGVRGLLLMALGSALLPGTEEFVRTMTSLGRESAGWPLPLALAIIALTPAICEEAAFRGVVLKGLSRTSSRVVTVVGSALLFGVLHVHPAHIIIAAVLGLLFSHATLQTRSLLAGALLHFINNAASVLVARTNPEMTLENLGWMGSWTVSLALLVPGVAALWLLRGPAPLPRTGGEPRLESAPA
jgi:sodium transport system permease protein